MKTHTNSHSPEILETRIAPAVFFVHGNNLTITDGTGADAAGSSDEVTAAAAAGATKAILLSAGDSLFFDLNGDNDASDVGDSLIAKVTSGKAMFVYTDRTTVAGKFEPTELTAVIAGDGFGGTIETGVNGHIFTALNAAGQFTFGNTDADPELETITLQKANIHGLTVKGRVLGSVIAGGSIDGLTLLGTANLFFGGANSILTGTAGAVPVGTNSGAAAPVSATLGMDDAITAPGTAGGDISKGLM